MNARSGLTAQDYVEIQNLYSYYNLCSDAGDTEGYASCFTEDGVLRAPQLDLEIEGRAALIDHKARDKAGRGERYRRHWNGSLHLEKLADGRVRGRCYLIAYDGELGALPVLADCGVYEDTVVEVDGEWKFAERSLTMDASSWTRS